MISSCINVSNEFYLNDVVEIHMEAFPGFFLTLLGKAFLTELYRGFIVSDSAVLLVNIDHDGSVQGFAAGAINPQLFFSNLRNTQFLSFLCASTKALLLNPIAVSKKLLAAVFYNGDTSNEIKGAALLSSIGVRRNSSGNGVGSTLLKCFENYLSINETSQVYLMTDKKGNDNVLEFYKKRGYEVESTIKKSDGRFMCRLIKKIQGPLV